jgi:hypothetical protein
LLDSGMCSGRVAVRGFKVARPSTEASPQKRIAEVELATHGSIYMCLSVSYLIQTSHF